MADIFCIYYIMYLFAEQKKSRWNDRAHCWSFLFDFPFFGGRGLGVYNFTNKLYVDQNIEILEMIVIETYHLVYQVLVVWLLSSSCHPKHHCKEHPRPRSSPPPCPAGV